MILPVILAGGAGSRLWPLSRSAHPKQLLPLLSPRTMLQETVLRAQAIAPEIMIICNQEHQHLVEAQLSELNTKNALIILEPIGKNTAPAISMAALYSQLSNPILLIMPADHIIHDQNLLIQAIDSALPFANSGKLVTFGIVPTCPQVEYGYLKVSKKIDHTNVYRVEKFVEKPNLETANSYLLSGNYFWNSGIFLFKASEYLRELKIHAPEILDVCTRNIDHIVIKNNLITLNRLAYNECPSNSIDYAVMEKTQNAVMVPLIAGWKDVGSWKMLHESQESDKDGNFMQGDVFTTKVKNSYLRAESRMLAVIGLDNHIVIETADAVLVAHKDNCQDMNELLSQLKKKQRQELKTHKVVHRPWGFYDILQKNDFFQVKLISVKPGASLSLQMHFHRSEHWVVVSGTAKVTRNEEVMHLSENESIYIPKMAKHRISNPGKQILEIIEVQYGTYLGEDDIYRFEDSYGRENINPIKNSD